MKRGLPLVPVYTWTWGPVPAPIVLLVYSKTVVNGCWVGGAGKADDFCHVNSRGPLGRQGYTGIPGAVVSPSQERRGRGLKNGGCSPRA